MFDSGIWYMLYSMLVRLTGGNGHAGFCPCLILGSASVTLCLVGVRRIPYSTVRPLKARK